jgi:riboflavin-specific deaminase-like protein
MEGAGPDLGVFDEAKAWSLLALLADRAKAGIPLVAPTPFGIGDDGTVSECRESEGAFVLVVRPDAEATFEARQSLTAATRQMLELYLPLCVGAKSSHLVVGHLGQSLDGQIATASGASSYVTGPDNIRHLHRLRALFDAVLVGAQTVERDDPLLTTRLVPGASPTRVILDPGLRLSANRRVFQDRTAPTLVLCSAESFRDGAFDHAEIVPVRSTEGVIDLASARAALAARGIRRVFVEGGGITISRFLAQRALDRLHLTVGSVFLGSGRPGVVLPAIDGLEGALRPRTRRFLMGEDVLFDCAFSLA